MQNLTATLIVKCLLIDIFLNENNVSHKETDLLYSYCVFWVTTPCCAITALLTFRGKKNTPDIIGVKDGDTFLQTLGTQTANYSMMSNPEGQYE